MVEQVDLMVLGAGPAGIGAAVEASRRGIGTVIVDEQPAAGGQVYRALSDELKVLDADGLGPDHALGQGLRSELAASSAETAFGHKVWFAAPGFRIEAVGPDGVRAWSARSLVVATGTHERVIPFPGWTTPGVLGLAATTILLKAQRMVPGENTVVAGCGPLVAAVASSIVKGGGRVAAMVDLAGPGDWLGSIPAMLNRPDLVVRGLGWLRLLRGAGVPMLFRHAVTEVVGGETVSEVMVSPVDRDWRPTSSGGRKIAADSLAVGHGLVPGTEVTRLLQAAHRFEESRGGWIAQRDGDMRTTVAGLCIAGDGAGISGAAAADLAGRIAGLTAALDLGKIDRAEYDRATEPWRRGLFRAARFGEAMARLMAPKAGLMATVTPDTVVCRCEDVTRREIEQALDDGALEVNQMKAWTRCGMGPCQGRMCGEAAARLVAARMGGREAAGAWTARVPIRPVTVDDLCGDFDYDDIWETPPA